MSLRNAFLHNLAAQRSRYLRSYGYSALAETETTLEQADGEFVNCSREEAMEAARELNETYTSKSQNSLVVRNPQSETSPAMKPILCSASVVRVVLNSAVGSWPACAIDPSKPWQWQDRRPIKNCTDRGDGVIKIDGTKGCKSAFGLPNELADLAPYKPGDVLYVRESFHKSDTHLEYRADYCQELAAGIKWTPSIHMPCELSRIHLEVMRVRVERVCEISDRDVIAEGVQNICDSLIQREHFKNLWRTLYGDKAWEKWVWVYDLKRIK